MSKSITVHVTDADAMEGVRGNAHYCAIQVALERVLPHALRISVDAQTIRWTVIEGDQRMRYVYLTPGPAQEYIRDFDAGKPFRPFTLHLSDPRVAHIPDRDPNTAARVSLRPSSPPSSRKLSTRVFGLQAWSQQKEVTA